MKLSLGSTLVLSVALLLVSSAAGAAECSGSWQVLSNGNRGSGGACAALGLDTHQAVCQAGQRYATYCDDASGGRYRTCQSNVPCNRERQSHNGGFNDNSDNWENNRRDENRNRQDEDRQYRSNQGQDCTQWDFETNRPCPAGTINRDCRNGCGER